MAMTTNSSSYLSTIPGLFRTLKLRFAARLDSWRTARRMAAELAGLTGRDRLELDVTRGNLYACGPYAAGGVRR